MITVQLGESNGSESRDFEMVLIVETESLDTCGWVGIGYHAI